MAIEKAIDGDDIYITPTPSPDVNATWAENKEIEVGLWNVSIAINCLGML